MRWSWFGEFFSALPSALKSLYEFGDPSGLGNGWWGVVILGIWGVFFTAIPIVLAKRWYGEREWASATMGCVAGLSILWWLFGILPSAWIFFLDANGELLKDTIIPGSFGFTIGDERVDVATNLYFVIRDVVVVIEHVVAFIAVFWAAFRIQEKYPRTLAAGEIKPEAGGYK